MSSVNFAQPDVTLQLDLSGVIRRAVLSSAMEAEGLREWVGRPWADTVGASANAQVRQMLDEARERGVSPFHQLQQRFPSGRELSVEYTTVRLGGDAGLLAIGRSLEVVGELRSGLISAQKSMERDYWKLRDVETRYRLLFETSSQPVLLIGADDLQVVEANPAAVRVLGLSEDVDVLAEMQPADREALHSMLARVREHGKAPGIVVRFGPNDESWLVRSSFVSGEPGAVFVLQLSQGNALRSPLGKQELPLDGIVERLSSAFAVLDRDGVIVRANAAFVALTQQPNEAAVAGQRFDRWMSHPRLEPAALLAGLRQGAREEHRLVVRGERGAETPVMIVSAADASQDARFVGVLLRKVSAPVEVQRDPELRASVEERVATIEREALALAVKLSRGGGSTSAHVTPRWPTRRGRSPKGGRGGKDSGPTETDTQSLKKKK